MCAIEIFYNTYKIKKKVNESWWAGEIWDKGLNFGQAGNEILGLKERGKSLQTLISFSLSSLSTLPHSISVSLPVKKLHVGVLRLKHPSSNTMEQRILVGFKDFGFN